MRVGIASVRHLITLDRSQIYRGCGISSSSSHSTALCMRWPTGWQGATTSPRSNGGLAISFSTANVTVQVSVTGATVCFLPQFLECLLTNAHSKFTCELGAHASNHVKDWLVSLVGMKAVGQHICDCKHLCRFC